ncbi:glycerate kinase family protein [Clostridium folliculivorans]|uniref:Glycerate kinase n=1 Tax=Clostridium folliculivorans TaxID=2886038 RepID=A0A9W5Y253_9CLOT|nr:glycerate kinase [Clostridium folliculivorans]GKU25092.1 glycerate kinase [Clostridium folliculivorans]GKU31190.1 glycerate kinase [Clostridium folliculivorans]
MKVVVAIDSMKGSLSSMEAGNAIKEGILRVKPEAEIVVKPLADGGEGTTDALLEGLGGEKVGVIVTGPMGKPVETYYGYLPEKKVAIMEMASAAGITLVNDFDKNPMLATTFGLGEMIKHAILKGSRHFVIGIGGSATNDGGIGMLMALGYEFLDEYGQKVGEGAQALDKIASISKEHLIKELKECTFQIACDVNNPLCGPNGATFVFGPQKGVTDEMKKSLDEAMRNYAKVSELFTGKKCSEAKGAGAAGGLGFGFLEFLNADLTPGIELVLKIIELEKEIIDADYVITGEGRLDFQTAMGKVPVGLAKLAKRYNKKVIAFAGSVTREAKECNNVGIDAFFPIVRGVTTIEEAMNPEIAKENMMDAVEQVFRLL